MKYAKNPTGFCFLAGTLVLTAVGLTAIENVQPGDLVYSVEATGVEQTVNVSDTPELKSVLTTYVHEVDETYEVTVDGEKIETTAEHPLYNDEGEPVAAKDLTEGDEVATVDGDSATVESVEVIHHEEPVKVCNFAVVDDHTYYVGETGVLVHNECDGSGLDDFQKKFKLNDETKTEVILPSKPHTNGTEGHWETILDEVEKMKDSGKYEKIYVNKGIRNEIPNAIKNNRQDIMGVRLDGLIDQVEVPSKTDTFEKLMDRMMNNQKMMGDRAGKIKVKNIGGL